MSLIHPCHLEFFSECLIPENIYTVSQYAALSDSYCVYFSTGSDIFFQTILIPQLFPLHRKVVPFFISTGLGLLESAYINIKQILDGIAAHYMYIREFPDLAQIDFPDKKRTNVSCLKTQSTDSHIL